MYVIVNVVCCFVVVVVVIMYSERQRTYTESAKFECKLAVLSENPNIGVSNSKFDELSDNYNKQFDVGL